MDLGIGGELGVDAGSAEEVERDFGLGDKLVPEGNREGFVGGA